MTGPLILRETAPRTADTHLTLEPGYLVALRHSLHQVGAGDFKQTVLRESRIDIHGDHALLRELGKNFHERRIADGIASCSFGGFETKWAVDRAQAMQREPLGVR